MLAADVRYWHSSFVRLDEGTVLSPRPGYDARWTGPSAGRILEDLRPTQSLAHRDAVFMCRDPQECDDCGAHTEWLFEVVPSARVERHDLAWASDIDVMLSEGVPPDDLRIVDLARRYWSGQASDHPTWEYLSPQATIVHVERY